MGAREIKHAVKLKEWSELIKQCRCSGMTVKNWCESNGIGIKTYYYWEKQVTDVVVQDLALQPSSQSGVLTRIDPKALPDGDADNQESFITIRHGDSSIILSTHVGADVIAELVKALNRHV